MFGQAPLFGVVVVLGVVVGLGVVVVVVLPLAARATPPPTLSAAAVTAAAMSLTISVTSFRLFPRSCKRDLGTNAEAPKRSRPRLPPPAAPGHGPTRAGRSDERPQHRRQRADRLVVPAD